ncbi:hypothetical protein EW026_g720 [Hermanssonia centrifuga]|uniref:Sulfite efflux pump SSU1 n=1 Tax=Hermanssonia centrifuga TaxID=98765 RepID=A0A4S4KYF1_9APHY|nr:hypothetical protein EW026_g720 [Hermanssonia centrifuga]
MSDVEAQACKVAHDTSSVTRSPQYVTWRERIRLFSWQWHAVVMATAVTSSIVHLFPYHNDSLGLKIVALVVFLIGLLVFTFDLVCIVAKAYLFPKECLELIRDPSKSSFAGFIAVGAAGLIDAGLNVNRDWNTGHNGFMYALWGFWWLDAALAYTIAFGVIFFILGQKSRDIAKVVPIWIIPVVALIASSTCGGLLGNALISHSHTMALVSSAFALTMCIIGLSFTTMITSSFLLRLFIHGVPEATTVLATFNTLTPLGQGGYSLLVNGENLSKLIPIQLGDDFPQSQLSGQMFYSICFCFAYILWCMGIAWSLVSIFSIGRRATKLPKFCVTHWCIVFPNGVFALLSVQIGNVLDSRFYKGFGAAWSIIVFILWTGLFIRSIPAFIDGTIFLSPVPRAPHKSRKKKSPRHSTDTDQISHGPEILCPFGKSHAIGVQAIRFST